VGILCALITVYMVVLVLRAVLSWFPLRPDSGFAVVARVVRDLTEPVLRPLRTVIPPAGMFDLSFLVLFLALVILRGVVCGL
jgi:YggT family protein